MEVCLKRGEEQDIRNGSLWIYDNEVDWYTDTCVDGGVVDVLDSRRRFVAKGLFNSKSKIVVRVLTTDWEEEINRVFFERRIRRAWEYRKSVGLQNACRVVFGDSDGLPGLTVDKFGDYLSFQIVSLGLEGFKREIIDILVGLFSPKGIFERNDLPVREKEGLPQQKGCVYGTVPELVEIQEHDAKMLVDIPGRSKDRTFPGSAGEPGHFKGLCKRENRAGPVLLHRGLFRPCGPVRRDAGGCGGRIRKRPPDGAGQCRLKWRELHHHPLRGCIRYGEADGGRGTAV